MPLVKIVKSIMTVFSACVKRELNLTCPQTKPDQLPGVLQGSKVLDGHRRGERDVHADHQEPKDGRRWTLHLHNQRVQRPVLQRLPRS